MPGTTNMLWCIVSVVLDSQEHSSKKLVRFRLFDEVATIEAY